MRLASSDDMIGAFAGSLGGVMPTAYRRYARGLRDRQAFEVEFESPDPAAASPPGSCPRGDGHRDDCCAGLRLPDVG
jgi:hypothetical protein